MCIRDSTKGYFELDVNINAELTISYVGYKSISFKSNENKILEIKLQRSTELRDVNVYGSRTNFGVQSSQMSAQTLSATQIKQLPRKR